MQHLATPVPVREIEGDHIDSGEGVDQGGNGGGVRPVADPDEKRALVEPDGVAALDEHRLLESRRDGTSAAASELAIVSGSRRRTSFPGRSRTAPSAPTSTGS